MGTSVRLLSLTVTVLLISRRVLHLDAGLENYGLLSRGLRNEAGPTISKPLIKVSSISWSYFRDCCTIQECTWQGSMLQNNIQTDYGFGITYYGLSTSPFAHLVPASDLNGRIHGYEVVMAKPL
jgi:hypothetical protein